MVRLKNEIQSNRNKMVFWKIEIQRREINRVKSIGCNKDFMFMKHVIYSIKMTSVIFIDLFQTDVHIHVLCFGGNYGVWN